MTRIPAASQGNAKLIFAAVAPFAAQNWLK